MTDSFKSILFEYGWYKWQVKAKTRAVDNTVNILGFVATYCLCCIFFDFFKREKLIKNVTNILSLWGVQKQQ